ncbi:hypothetical protein M1523_03785 [Patescibacteria group bacterium]|nr:hypothetical protein [Patescibacteria group bacterium]MCL5091815.1 hypothetical protein [Patescibacteria group bacterium]
MEKAIFSHNWQDEYVEGQIKGNDGTWLKPGLLLQCPYQTALLWGRNGILRQQIRRQAAHDLWVFHRN